MSDRIPLPACICRGHRYRRVFVYHEPPEGEIRFVFSTCGRYYREVWCCTTCNHYVSVHQMDMQALYEHDYVSSTYGGVEGLRRNFQRIMSLPPGKSDNLARVQRVKEFAAANLEALVREKWTPTILDVGSGLCVFLDRMKEAGWDCTALDNDPRLCQHAQDTAGVKAVCSDFLTLENLGQFDAVTFNKVLEHVENPVAMLAKSRVNLRPGGFIYVELPDGEAAAAEGLGREEFFIEHHHIFSMASLALLAQHSGLAVRLMERLREPSTKFTLRAFLIPKQ